MKKVGVALGLITVLLLASCTKTEKDQVSNTLTDDSMEMQETLTAESSDEMMNTDENTMMEEEDEMMDDTMMEENSSGETMMDDTMMEEDEMMNDEAMEDTMEETVEASGIYTNYEPSLVGQTENSVLFFHASWCPSCRALDSAISGEEIPEGLTVLKVDYDSETELKSQYGIVSQHTLVQVDGDGNEIKKWVGGNSIDDIVEQLQ